MGKKNIVGKDYFGFPIKVGDVVRVVVKSGLYDATVTKIWPKTLEVEYNRTLEESLSESKRRYHNQVYSKEFQKKVVNCILDGLYTDGAHHKQEALSDTLSLIESPEEIQKLKDQYGDWEE